MLHVPAVVHALLVVVIVRVTAQAVARKSKEHVSANALPLKGNARNTIAANVRAVVGAAIVFNLILHRLNVPMATAVLQINALPNMENQSVHRSIRKEAQISDPLTMRSLLLLNRTKPVAQRTAVPHTLEKCCVLQKIQKEQQLLRRCRQTVPRVTRCSAKP